MNDELRPPRDGEEDLERMLAQAESSRESSDAETDAYDLFIRTALPTLLVGFFCSQEDPKKALRLYTDHYMQSAQQTSEMRLQTLDAIAKSTSVTMPAEVQHRLRQVAEGLVVEARGICDRLRDSVEMVLRARR